MATPMGTLIQAEGKIKESVYEAMLEDIQLHWRDHYSINFNNYAVQDVYAPRTKILTST
jgi:formylmethanofuran dehydrogenase subunit A